MTFSRSRLLSFALVMIVLGLAFAPFAFPGVKALNVAAIILIFITLVGSYDLLLGYTGIKSRCTPCSLASVLMAWRLPVLVTKRYVDQHCLRHAGGARFVGSVVDIDRPVFFCACAPFLLHDYPGRGVFVS